MCIARPRLELMLRIAIAQTPGVRLEQWRETLALVLDLFRSAAERRADIVVLPECAWPGYHLGSREAWNTARAAGMPTEVSLLEELTKAARRHRLTVCAGYVAEEGGRLFNRACLISRGGDLLGTYDKCFLWDFDRRWFTPGSAIRPIDTEFGPVGIMICADARLPEIPATLAARGAKLILQPTAWVNAGTPERPWNPQAEFLIAARAAEFGVPIASASKWGREHDTVFVGSSLICDASGRILAKAPGVDGRDARTTVLTADVELPTAARVQVSEAERNALLSADPPHPPAAAGTVRLTLARGVLRIEQFERPEAAPVPTTPGVRLDVGCPVEGMIPLGSALIGSLSDEAASRFPPIRVLALRGVHLVAVWGDGASEPALRARAAENRIFIAHVRGERLDVYAPSGLRVAASGSESVSAGSGQRAGSPLEIDLNAAIDKHVAWQTDVLAGRSPGLYAF
jgi:predicted amidohydrolase